jgi:hypothetical protein
MASVNGVYVGPLSAEDVPRMLDDIRAGRPVLPNKQLAKRRVADPHANSQEYPEHPIEQRSALKTPVAKTSETKTQDTAGGAGA